jgi:anti-anti-sigma factor
VEQPRITTHHLEDAVWLVSLSGEHDVATAPGLNATLRRIFSSGSCVVVDLTEATFIDSSILSGLVDAHRHAGGSPTESFAVVVPHESAATRLFGLTGASDFIRTFNDPAAALDWCRACAPGA